MSVLVQTLWSDHSRCDLEFEDWGEIFENKTEGPTTTDWNQRVPTRPAEPETGHGFMLPPSDDEEEEEEDEGITAATRSPPIPYRLVWMDDGNDGVTPDLDARSSGVSELEEAVAPGGPEGPSTLDALQVLEVEQEVRDDARWLYESPQRWCDRKEEEEVDPSESALRWSRRVLDHPSPDMEAARRVLNNILDRRCRSQDFKLKDYRSQDFKVKDYRSQDSKLKDYRSQDSKLKDYRSQDSKLKDYRSQDSKLKDYRSQDSKLKDYRSQDLTDIQVLAREQEASLRGELSRSSSSPSPALGDISNLDALRSARRRRPSSPWGAPRCSGPSANHRGPQLRKLQHRVTEFKLLKLLQSKEAAVTPGDGGPAPLLRTSLCSLQAARKNRSLETGHAHCDHAHTGHAHYAHAHTGHTHPDPHHHDDPLTSPLRAWPQSGVSPDRRGSTVWSASQSHATSSKTPPPSSGILSSRGRVFAVPERPPVVAWGWDSARR